MWNNKVLFIVFYLASLVQGVRIKRVKAGMHYKQHDPVHIVVNKIGCVC
jgi:hypothetical protein